MNSGDKCRLTSVFSTRGSCRLNSGNALASLLMNPDFVDLLRALRDADARFLIVGAYALAHYGRPRATGDLDIWLEATADNAPRVMRALVKSVCRRAASTC